MDILIYKLDVCNCVWYVNEIDLSWIFIGCYIFGIGGGGFFYLYMILF